MVKFDGSVFYPTKLDKNVNNNDELIYNIQMNVFVYFTDLLQRQDVQGMPR